MKHKRIINILIVAIVVSLLMMFIPVIPASAFEIITLSVEKAEVGENITLDGSGFTVSNPPDHLYDVDIYFSSDVIEVGDEINYYNNYYEAVKLHVYTDGSGSFSKVIEIPAELSDSREDVDVHGGTYYFYITQGGHTQVIAYTEFTVIGISEFNPISGPVGTEVELCGIGFEANDDVQVLFAGSVIDVSSGDRRFKSNGSFELEIEIPESTAGEQIITVEDEAGHSGQVNFTVEPKIIPSPDMASTGEVVTITGTGFAEDVDIFVYFDGDIIYITGDYYTSDYGSFEAQFIVPEVEPGSYLVEVEDDVFNSAEAELEVGPGLTIIPMTTVDAPGNVGDIIELSGSGFLPSHELNITYASDSVTFTTTSLADGSFSYELTIPPSIAGEHTITVSDGTSTKEALFFMESTPPEVPILVLPEIDTEADSNTEFDWTDVSDTSLPITYELQVATNSQFTADSILVNRIGLTASAYTLPDEEELESTGEETPYYYWRVRAKDAASNQSGWSNSIRFTVGGGFSMPGWLIYTLIGIGVVIVFILGLWLGRRPSGEEDYW